MHREGMSPDTPRHVLTCIECGVVSASPVDHGWKGYRSEDPGVDELPARRSTALRARTPSLVRPRDGDAAGTRTERRPQRLGLMPAVSNASRTAASSGSRLLAL